MPERSIPLEPTSDEMRALTQRVIDVLVRQTEALEESATSRNRPSVELLARVRQAPPESPVAIDGLLDLVEQASEQSYQTAGPGYLAYIPGGGIFTSALAGFLAAGMNRYTGKLLCAPALVAMEQSVLRWMCDLFQFPAEAQALLTPGGSMANTIALTIARTRHAEGRVDRATVYLGEHAHGCIVKAARAAGLGRGHVRVVRSTDDLRMDVDHLRELIRADRDAGLVPVCVFAAAGTTNTGAIDPLADVVAVARQFGVWCHVDAAYGGLFQLTQRGRSRMAGIEAGDSITLDPHKSLFLPLGTGAIVVRDQHALRETYGGDADYMRDLDCGHNTDFNGLPDFDALSPELTREFRGLRVWLPLHLHGVAAFRGELDEKLDLAEHVYQTLVADERLDVPWKPELSVVVFRLRGGDDAEQLRFLQRINDSQRILLSSTRVNQKVFLRVAILSMRTHANRIDEALQIIARAARLGEP